MQIKDEIVRNEEYFVHVLNYISTNGHSYGTSKKSGLPCPCHTGDSKGSDSFSWTYRDGQYKGQCHHPGCQLNGLGNILDLYMKANTMDLKDKEQFKVAIKEVAEICGIPIPEYKPAPTEIGTLSYKNTKEDDIPTIIEKAHARVEETDYFHKRGLSDETIKEYQLGYMPKCTFRGYDNGPGAIIPYPGEDYYFTRLINPTGDFKCLKLPGSSPIFNAQCINDNNIIWVTEGQFDCLSLIELGFSAISTDSASSIQKLIDCIETNNINDKVFIIAFDNDSAGYAGSVKLISALEERGITAIRYKPSKANDINDMLVNHTEQLEEDTMTIYAVAEKLGSEPFMRHVYNFTGVQKTIAEEGNVYLVSNKTNCDYLISRGFCATTTLSSKWDENYTEELKEANIVYLPDTTEHGDRYKKQAWFALKDHIKSFKVVNLPGLKEMGDNKDVTDWLEAGHTKAELINIIRNRSLDLLSLYELQQDYNGIYKYIFNKKGCVVTNEDGTPKKSYITDFNVIEGTIIRNTDSDEQTIQLKIRNRMGYVTHVKCNGRELFADLRTFKKAIGIDNVFTGTGEDLGRLHKWVYSYFIASMESCYTVTGIRNIIGEYELITNNGVLKRDGTFNTSVRANNDLHNINFTGVTPLTKDEANKLCKYLFSFNTPTNVYNSLGLGLAHMLNSYIRESVKDNLPILQITGQSNCGKSKTFDILRMLYGNTQPAIIYGGLTKFTIMKILNDTYLPVFIDETKPECYPKFIQDQLTAAVRGMTEGNISLRGKKDQTHNTYKTNSTLLFCGEDELKDETAIKNRSNIVLYTESAKSRTGSQAINYLCKSTEGRQFLHKLSYSLYLEVLNNWDVDSIEVKYDIIMEKYNLLNTITSDRECNTVVYTLMGLELLTDTLSALGVNVSNYMNMEEAPHLIINNVRTNVLEGSEGSAQSELDKMLLLIDSYVDPVYKPNSDNIMVNVDYIIRDNELYMDVTSCYNKLKVLSKKYDVTVPLSVRAFRQQLEASTVCKRTDRNANTQLPILNSFGDVQNEVGGKRFRAFVLDLNELSKIGCCNLANTESQNVQIEDTNVVKLKFANRKKHGTEVF